MANKSKTKCLSCREIFTVDMRNRGRQKYCAKSECQRESKAASQRVWLSSPRTASTSVTRRTPPGYGAGKRSIRTIGATQHAISAEPYKIPCLVTP